MLEPDFILRQPIINYITHYLGELTHHRYTNKLEEFAEILEHALYNRAKEYASPSQVYVYGNSFVLLLGYLKRPVDGTSKNIAEMYVEGDVSCEDIALFREALPLSAREATRQCYHELLSKVGLERYAGEIEESCYQSIIVRCKHSDTLICRRWDTQFKEIYYRHCATVKYYIDSESSFSTYLLGGIKNNTIKPADIGFMTEKDLCPSAFESESKIIEIRVNQKIDRKVSNLFKCPKCKLNKVTYEEYQSRSLDEAPDYLCECLNPVCGHRFKVCP